MTVTLGFDVEEFDFPLERGRGIDFGTQLAVSSEGLEFLLDLLAAGAAGHVLHDGQFCPPPHGPCPPHRRRRPRGGFA